LTLGAVHIGETTPEVRVATMVAQRGYGQSAAPRIRYAALKQCLELVSAYAREHDASVHMPRIGAGQAGGRWEIIRELIEETLTRRGIGVTVYVPPNQSVDEKPAELTLGI
jgi:O-acetyl-ADP-ribose deacetylase (regulator of RNase III)